MYVFPSFLVISLNYQPFYPFVNSIKSSQTRKENLYPFDSRNRKSQTKKERLAFVRERYFLKYPLESITLQNLTL